LPDTKIGAEPSHQRAVLALIRELRPGIVLSPYWNDRHPDHEGAGLLVRSACFYAGVASLGEDAPHRPHAVYYYMIHSPFEPSFVVDITPVWQQKLEILRTYRTQFLDEDADAVPTAISSPRFLEHHEARCIYFGAMIGASVGEPFLTFGPVPLDGLPRAANKPATTARHAPYKSF
jgi:N-acetylglucosamine malate deacetylase 1